MTRLLYTLLLALAGGPAAASQVEAFLAGLETLEAAFTQVVTDRDGRLLERAAGTLAVARPGRFRWEYTEPAQLVVSDGRTIWHHDRELEQVSIRAAGEALSQTPAALLAGQVPLAEAYVVTPLGSEGGLTWERLTPRQAQGDFAELRLGFEGRELRRMLLADRLGQHTELRFERLRRNPRLDEGLFRYEVPPGVDVVGSPAP